MFEDRDNPDRTPQGSQALTGAQSAQRTVDLLLLIAQSADGMTAGEIAQSLGLDRQVVYHLLQTLKHCWWAISDQAGRWRIGPACAVVENGLRAQSGSDKAAPVPAVGGQGVLPAPPGAWLTIAAENRQALLSTVRGRAALAALEELSSYWDFNNG